MTILWFCVFVVLMVVFGALALKLRDGDPLLAGACMIFAVAFFVAILWTVKEIKHGQIDKKTPAVETRPWVAEVDSD